MEDRVCELFNITHIKLRTLAKRHNLDIDYNFVSEDMLQEIDHTWTTRQIQNRYCLSYAVSQSIHDGTYKVPNPTPTIDTIELESLLQQGKSVQDISSQFEVSVYHIRLAMKKYGLVSYAQRKKLTAPQYEEIAELLIAGDMPSKDIAILYNISPSMVSHIRSETLSDKPQRKPYKRIDKELILALHEKGHTQESIAHQLDVSQSSVSRIVACRSL